MSPDRNNPESRRAEEPPAEPAHETGDWPARHPDVFGEAGDLPRLRELWQSAPPPEPAPAAWSALLSRIEGALPPAPPRPRRRHRWPLWGVLSLTAAAALVAILLARPWRPATPAPERATPPTEQVAVEPYPVVEDQDVIIISMDTRDTGALVVGEPPVSDDYVFASPADIKVIKVEPHHGSGDVAHLQQGGDVPMFVPVARAADPEDD